MMQLVAAISQYVAYRPAVVVSRVLFTQSLVFVFMPLIICVRLQLMILLYLYTNHIVQLL